MIPVRSFRLTLVAVLTVFGFAWVADAGPRRGRGNDAEGRQGRLSRNAAAKARSGRAEMVEVIVTYEARPGAAETQAIRQMRGKTRRAFGRLPMRALRIPAHRLERLAARPGVQLGWA